MRGYKMLRKLHLSITLSRSIEFKSIRPLSKSLPNGLQNMTTTRADTRRNKVDNQYESRNASTSSD